jgi:branched-chain amino acid transport system substrate-binding protein
VIEDAQYQVPKAVQAANKLLQRDKVFAIVGGLGTPMNNAVLKDQLALGVPNLFPITAARQMYDPFHPLKFSGFAPYYHQIRSGLKHLVETKGRKAVCIMYQDTDFGQEVLEGTRDQLKEMNLPLVETATHKPTDQDFTAQISRLRGANCDLVVLGSIVRDSILPYATSRKIGWDVDMLGSTATYDFAVSGAQGGVTDGLHAMGQIDAPYRDTATPEVRAWMDAYKQRYNDDPNIAAALGHAVMDLVVFALDKAGPDLTVQSLVKALESIDGYRDIFGGAPQSFGPDKRVGSLSSAMYQVQKGRWVRITEPLMF